MDIAIIGAGNVGTALATAFTRAGHHVTIALARSGGCRRRRRGDRHRLVATSNADAARAADVVILAVPVRQRRRRRRRDRRGHAGKAVVDVSNRISFGPDGPEIDTTSSNAEELAGPASRTRPSSRRSTRSSPRNQADPIVDGVQLDGFVAGDDAAAKATVLELVASIGLRPVDVGPLAAPASSRRWPSSTWRSTSAQRDLAVGLEARRRAGRVPVAA